MSNLQRVSQGDTPSVVSGLLAYALFMELNFSLNGLMAMVVFVGKLDDPQASIEEDLTRLFRTAVVFAIHLVPLVGRRVPWAWWYNLFLICLSFLVSCLMWPISIAMLIYWLQPETKAFYGKA